MKMLLEQLELLDNGSSALDRVAAVPGPGREMS